MTDTPTAAEAEAALSAYTVLPEPGSRLAQLHAAYVDAKATADEAAARLKSITDGIKVELTQAAPGSQRITLLGLTHSQALQLTYSTSWRVDSKRLKLEDPETYVRYAKQSGSWTLRAVPAGQAGDPS